jgi:accessory colonization factor AcfC
MKKVSLGISLIIAMVGVSAQQADTLFVYGPGGPQAPIEECAKLYSKKMSVPVKVLAGPEDKWIETAKQNADVIFGGAEYMLTQFAVKHKGLLDSNTTTELYKRAAGILVRKGNPKNIKTLKDLTKKGIRLLNIDGAGQLGMWEDIAGKQNLIGGIQKNIGGNYGNTALGIEAWKRDTSYDAWITFASWHHRLKDVTTLVKIPPVHIVYRGTPIAVTTITDQKNTALHFLNYLQSTEAHKVFVKWGWE